MIPLHLRKYTCFTLGSILMFEASTVFQRLKSMATLRGMSTKSPFLAVVHIRVSVFANLI